MVLRRIPIQSQSPLNASFEKSVYSALQKWHVPGVAIGVVDGDQTWAEVFASYICSNNHISILTLTLKGIRNIILPFYSSHSLNFVLRRQHHQSFYRCDNGSTRRRQR